MDESGELLVCGGSWVLESAAGLTISWLVVKERRINGMSTKDYVVICLKERLVGWKEREREKAAGFIPNLGCRYTPEYIVEDPNLQVLP